MPKFILNRDHDLASKLGASVSIKKNVPFFAPPFLQREIEALGGELIEHDEPGADGGEGDKTPATAEERKAAMLAAFDVIMNAGNKVDITDGGKGHPTQKALSRDLGWTPEAKERDAAWAEYVKGKKA